MLSSVGCPTFGTVVVVVVVDLARFSEPHGSLYWDSYSQLSLSLTLDLFGAIVIADCWQSAIADHHRHFDRQTSFRMSRLVVPDHHSIAIADFRFSGGAIWKTREKGIHHRSGKKGIHHRASDPEKEKKEGLHGGGVYFFLPC